MHCTIAGMALVFRMPQTAGPTEREPPYASGRK
jgi:hypothetical protein